MALPAAVPDPTPVPESRRSIRFELLLVFGITLGASGVRAVIDLIDALLQPTPLAGQSVGIVVPQAQASWTDLALQLVSITVQVGWGMLGIYLLWRAGYQLKRDIGLGGRFGDLGRSVLLAAAIGLPGIVFYVVGYRLGLNVAVVPAALGDNWWSVPVLVLAALKNGFLEEVLVVGYFLTRLRQLRVDPWLALIASALLRASYHLYQGFGQAAGNAIMGLVFGYVWLRWRRLWPLIGAHALIDIGAFVGYTYLGTWFTGLLS